MRNMLFNLDFIKRHKTNPKDFTRTRKLPFADVFILILRNSVKSLQLMLNEFAMQCNKSFYITASAFTQARTKLKHTAYIELNDGIVSRYYDEQPFKKLLGFRIIGCDGSKLVLPKSEEIKNEFGRTAIANQISEDLGEFYKATFMAYYDVLNNICVKALLAPGNVYEANLATKMLDGINNHDLLIFDRGFASSEFMATLIQKNLNFIIRFPQHSLSPVREMFEMVGPSDQVIKIAVRSEQTGLPKEITIRLIRIILSTGEVEILVTNLLDQTEFKEDEFKELYFLRWGVEGYFAKVKGRLNLENFTGKSVESIKQDFWSTILISNLETILTEDVEESVNDKLPASNLEKSINKAVSFNAIKNLAFKLLTSNQDQDQILEKLTQLFLMNMHVVRDGRTAVRKKKSDVRSNNYQKRMRKHVF